MPGIVTGKNAKFYIKAKGHTGGTHAVYGLSDFSLSFDRGTVEQELIGMPGNYFFMGGLSVDGSFTMCKFAASAQSDALVSIVESEVVEISGSVDTGGTNPIRWHFKSAQITGYDVGFGDADTITEASIDFTVLYPYKVSYVNGLIKDY